MQDERLGDFIPFVRNYDIMCLQVCTCSPPSHDKAAYIAEMLSC